MDVQIYRLNTSFLLFIMAVICLCAGYPARAQTADTLIENIIQSNPKLQALKLEYESAFYRQGEFRDLPDPVFSTGFFPLPTETGMSPQRLQIGVSQALPWNSVLKNRANVVKQEAEMLRYEYDIARSDLWLTLNQIGAQLWQIDQEAALLEERYPLLESWYQVALARMESYTGASSDVLQIQSLMNEIKNALHILEQERKSYEAQYRRLAGTVKLPDGADWTKESFKDFILKPAEDLDALPDMQWYEQERKVSEAILERNRTDRLPTLELGLDYIFVGQMDNPPPGYRKRDLLMPMVSVQVPIFREKYKAVEQTEKARQLAISFHKEDKKREILEQLEQARILFLKEEMNLEFYENQLEIIGHTIEMVSAGYSAHGDKFEELLRLQNQVIDFNLKKLESKVNIYMAHLTIERWQPKNVKNEE